MSEDTEHTPRTRRGELTRQRLIDAAEQLLVSAGDESAVSVRAVERAAGVTAPTIYRHFADLDSLLAEVAAVQFGRLSRALRDAGEFDDAVEQLAAFGKVFARFALDNPGQYRVLFMNRASSETVFDDERMRATSSFGHLKAAVQRAIDEGALSPHEDADEVACLLLMSVHGVVSLVIARPHGGWPDPEYLVGRMILAIGYGLVPRPDGG